MTRSSSYAYRFPEHRKKRQWLCAQLLRELGLRVAQSSIEPFGEQRALVVQRFDRHWTGVDESAVQRKRFKPREGMWIARLPQEDFCQATGRPPSQKYEADGGLTMAEGLELLAGSEHAPRDQSDFVLAQLSFWLLAATDGHGKNFSIFHRPGGMYEMSPLYDILSAWPIIGHGKNQLPIEKARLAMAVRGKRAHYRINEIQPRHWKELARRTGVPGLWERMRSHVASALPALDRLEGELPRAFPERVFTAIREGVRSQARHFEQTAGQ